MNHNNDFLRLILAGPFFLLILTAVLSAVSLLTARTGHLERLTTWGLRAAARLERGRLIPTLWGISATVLIVAFAAFLFGTQIAALLGVLDLIFALILASFGLAVSALTLGGKVASALGQDDIGTLPAFIRGLPLLFFAVCVPIVGWILVLVEIAAGIGALLETLLARNQ